MFICFTTFVDKYYYIIIIFFIYLNLLSCQRWHNFYVLCGSLLNSNWKVIWTSRIQFSNADISKVEAHLDSNKKKKKHIGTYKISTPNTRYESKYFINVNNIQFEDFIKRHHFSYGHQLINGGLCRTFQVILVFYSSNSIIDCSSRPTLQTSHICIPKTQATVSTLHNKFSSPVKTNFIYATITLQWLHLMSISSSWWTCFKLWHNVDVEYLEQVPYINSIVIDSEESLFKLYCHTLRRMWIIYNKSFDENLDAVLLLF